MDGQMVPKSHQNRAIGRPWLSFSRFGEVLKECVLFMSFWIGKSLTDSLKEGGSFGRRRRERRRAGEEKEFGF
jgi:hypothetical protein